MTFLQNKIEIELIDPIDLEVEEYMEFQDLARPHKIAYGEWKAKTYPKLLAEWKKDIDPIFMRQRRVVYLKGELEKVREEYTRQSSLLEKITNIGLKKLILGKIKVLQNRILSLQKNITFLENNDNNHEEFAMMLARAKERQISEFIHIERNMCKCPFHKDGKEDNPSMRVYGNRAYCFTESAAFDVIDIVQKLYGYNFKEAVKFLGGNP